MSDNWIVQNLNSALNTWNEKLAEIWTLLTQSPESFKGGDIWNVTTGINGALTAIGYGLLVLFFAAGIVKTCGSFTDMKKPEHALKAFIRFALAQGAIMYGSVHIQLEHPSIYGKDHNEGQYRNQKTSQQGHNPQGNGFQHSHRFNLLRGEIFGVSSLESTER